VKPDPQDRAMLIGLAILTIFAALVFTLAK